ncbi:LOB domain-containing protein 15 [Ancistrocladus abbreviatus]
MSRERERFDEIGKKIKREGDHATTQTTTTSTAGKRQQQMSGPAAVVGAGILNTITPCAACKLLRRRCAQECPFSPYFSPHEPQKFASVHKVFGASNVSKMLMEVPESQRADAANSLVYEANVRLRDPVYGCMGAISALQHQIQALEAELNAVRAQILKYKYRDQTNINIVPLLSTGGAAVSIAVPPPAPRTPAPPLQQQPPLPPPPPLLSPPLSLQPPTSSTASSAYVRPSGTPDYSSISDDNVSYFG